MKRTLHDPRLFALPYPHNLMLAIAKADLIDPDNRTSHKPPVIDVDSNLEEFITSIPLSDNLSYYETEIITRHYKYHMSLATIAHDFGCTSENIRTHRNHALNKLLKAYLKVKPLDELPTLEPRIISEIKEQLAHSTSAYSTPSLFSIPSTPTILTPSTPSYPKPAKNSIRKNPKRRHPRVKQYIASRFYIRKDGVLYIELKGETDFYHIGEFYSYSNSEFSISGIIIDISLAGILLSDWEVKRK